MEIPGVSIGHWTDATARTGCTVVVLPPNTIASGEVRGGAPATREFELLDPTRLVGQVDAVVLSGGSAFGLAAADGVMAALEAQGRGFETAATNVPIVVAMGLYDLAVGDASVRPSSREGAVAFADAVAEPRDAVADPGDGAFADGEVGVGAVGAGSGATTGKWRQPTEPTPSGIGMFSTLHEDLLVTALVVNNASGDVDDGTVASAIADGTFDDWPETFAASSLGDPSHPNTVIGVVITNASLNPVECKLVAQGAHDGLARAIFPPHTRSDGDAFVAAATGEVVANVDKVRAMAVVATEQAVRNSADTVA